MGYFLSHNNVLLKDFGTYIESVTKSLCEHIENIVKINNRPYQFCYGNNTDKGELVRTILDEKPIEDLIRYVTRYCSRPVIAESRILNYDGENVTWYYTES